MKKRVKVPTILQMEATECGAASLAMVFAYYGKYMPLEQMRIETGVSRDGCNAANIMRAAKRFGLACRAFRKEPEELRKFPMPCIIHWNFNHFVVLEGFSGKYAYLNDPAVGRRKLTLEELDEGFTGVFLTFERTKEFVRSKRQRRVGELGVVAVVVDEAADGGAGAFQAFHGRDGIGLALEAFADSPDGPEALHRDTGRSAHMTSRLIAPKYENLAGIKLTNQWRSGPGYHLSGKQKVNRMCVSNCYRLAVYGAAFPFWRGRHYPYSFGIQRFANSFNHLYVFD